MSTEQVEFAKTDWLLENPEEAWENVKKFMESFVSCDTSETFKKRKTFVFIYASNKLENTLPPGCSKGDTFKLLDTLYDTALSQSDEKEEEPVLWNADGQESRAGTSRQQLKQHLKAFLYLNTIPPSELSKDSLCEVHRILMLGAINDKKEPLQQGFRATSAYAGDGHVYLEPQHISESVERALQKYKSLLQSDILLAAAFLFYQTITIHPFENGNGRFCRLLLSYSLQQSGFPFPVLLSTGHKRARSNYMHAIKLARTKLEGKPLSDRLSELTAITLMSMHDSVQNYQENRQIAQSL